MSAFRALKQRTEAVVLPPGPDDTFNTLERPEGGRKGKRKRKTGRTQQLTIRVAEGFGDRIRLMAERDNAKLGDVLEGMWVAWEAAGAGRCADVPPFADRRAGRKHELKIYATDFVYQAAPKVAAAREMSLSQLFEELLAHEVHRLNPHGGRFGVYVKRDG